YKRFMSSLELAFLRLTADQPSLSNHRSNPRLCRPGAVGGWVCRYSLGALSISRLCARQSGNNCPKRHFPLWWSATPGSMMEWSCGRRKHQPGLGAARPFARDWLDTRSRLGSPGCKRRKSTAHDCRFVRWAALAPARNHAGVDWSRDRIPAYKLATRQAVGAGSELLRSESGTLLNSG